MSFGEQSVAHADVVAIPVTPFDADGGAAFADGGGQVPVVWSALAAATWRYSSFSLARRSETSRITAPT